MEHIREDVENINNNAPDSILSSYQNVLDDIEDKVNAALEDVITAIKEWENITQIPSKDLSKAKKKLDKLSEQLH